MKLIVLDQAKDSLRRSLRVLGGTYSKAYLKKLRKQVTSEIEWLKGNPGAGQIEDGLEGLGRGHRRIVILIDIQAGAGPPQAACAPLAPQAG